MKSIVLQSNIINDSYTEYVYNTFDIQNKEVTTVDVPLIDNNELSKMDWNIGVIYGSSGSGKTTILKNIGELKKVSFDPSKPLISNFSWLEPSEASKLLTAIGLSSVPTWLRPFRLLSNGEKYRAALAYTISSANDGDTILIDEYTSVVDRDVAKAMSYALQKYIRRENKKIILASCHYDIMEWLMPDWTFSPQKGGVLERNDYLRQGKPSIELRVSRCESKIWEIFKKHHYLTEDVNVGCKFLLFEWNKKPVGMVAIINRPRKGCPNAFGLSRTVVLPDFQGMGIGSKISDFTCGILKNIGGIPYAKTVNPALGEYRNKSPKWRGTINNGKGKAESSFDVGKYKNRVTRVSYSHEYIGETIDGYDDLLKPIDELRKNK